MITACNRPLGMENRRISDNQLTAPSEYKPNFSPSNARLNRPEILPTTGAWSARTNDLNQWIQADLEGLKWVSGVVTQGRNVASSSLIRQWVSKFNVHYSKTGVTWSNVEDDSGQNVRNKQSPYN